MRRNHAKRVMDRVDVRGPDECWPWTGRTRQWDGRGKVRWLGKSTASSKAVWSIWARITPPRHLFVCHSCNNPKCCNPAHLYLATHAENQQYAVESGTQTNTRKTHCPQGHPYSGDNLVLEKRGDRTTRKCRICKTARMADWYRRTGRNQRMAKKAAKP